jgi:hypothetical protein
MQEDKMRKRLMIDRSLNERVKSLAKERNISSDLVIEEAIEFYMDFEENFTSNDNMYMTKRMNEMTREFELLRNENASFNQALLNRLDMILEYQGPTNYL